MIKLILLVLGIGATVMVVMMHGDKGYYVMPEETYKEVLTSISYYIGVYAEINGELICVKKAKTTERKRSGIEMSTKKDLYGIVEISDINQIPTAYDVGKVMRELKELSKSAEENMNYYLDNSWKDECVYNKSFIEENRYKAFNIAMEIVKSAINESEKE